MENYPYRQIKRRKTRVVNVGDVLIGGDNPIAVQTMTNTLTTDISGTLKQIKDSVAFGADIVRVSCPDEESTTALKEIVKHSSVPIVADIHFHYKRAIEAAEAGAKCLRINPGNIGNNDRVKEVIKAAKDYGCSIRIGVNGGSLESAILNKYASPTPEALVESAQRHIGILEDNDFHNFKVSVKASDLFLAVKSYELLATKGDFPLHIGITEAGGLNGGTILSSIGLGMLMYSGIGDTIRVSLSADPVEEVKAAYKMLKYLDLRHRGIKVVSCPSCARMGFNVVDTVNQIESQLEHIINPISISIIGCVVNGPGEALYTDVAITGGGKGSHKLYLRGKPIENIKTEELIPTVIKYAEQFNAEYTQNK